MPHTTRKRILRVVNVAKQSTRPATKIVFVDTPGIHKPENSLNRKMMQEVYDALEGRDLLLVIVDVTQRFGPGDQFVVELVKRRSRVSPPARTKREQIGHPKSERTPDRKS